MQYQSNRPRAVPVTVLPCRWLRAAPAAFATYVEAHTVPVMLTHCFFDMQTPCPTCPLQVVEGNPCYEYAAYVVFPWFGQFEVARAEKNGGNVTYTDLEAFKADYTSGALHPGVCLRMDLLHCIVHVCVVGAGGQGKERGASKGQRVWGGVFGGIQGTLHQRRTAPRCVELRCGAEQGGYTHSKPHRSAISKCEAQLALAVGRARAG
jgi:hypothetical protein